MKSTRLDLHSTIQSSPLGAERHHVHPEAGGGDELEERREVEAAQVPADAARQALAGEEGLEHASCFAPRRGRRQGRAAAAQAPGRGAAAAKGPVTGS